jgi:hypothetical protein
MSHCERLPNKESTSIMTYLSAPVAILVFPNIEQIDVYVSTRTGVVISPSNFRFLRIIDHPLWHSFTRITFPPGTFYHVYLPSGRELNPETGLNGWLREQVCPSGCDFEARGKRPSRIRAHYAQCGRGANLHPLSVLCRLAK